MARTVITVGAAAWFGLGAVGWAQSAGEAKMVLVEPPTPLLTRHLPGMILTPGAEGAGAAASAHTFAGTECLPLAGGAGAAPATPAGTSGRTCAEVLKEDGLSRFASGSYRAGAGAAGSVPVQAFALEFGDATGAYSAYTFYRSLEKAPRVTEGDAKLGKAHETTTDGEGSLVWAGTAVLRVKGRLPANELAALVLALPKVGGRRGLAPLLPTYLAAKGIETASVRYALGPVSYQAMGGTLPAELLAWDKSAEVASAEYAGRGGRGLETLLLYPTPQIAGDRGRALEKYVNDGGAARFGTLKMRRVGPLLGMVTGGLPVEQAQELMAGLHLSQELSFDKPMPLEFHAEVRKTATLLESIAMFCVVGTVAAVVLAVFLGGARAGIRVLQGKSAASDPEFLTINLRTEKKGLFVPKGGMGDGRAG